LMHTVWTIDLSVDHWWVMGFDLLRRHVKHGGRSSASEFTYRTPAIKLSRERGQQVSLDEIHKIHPIAVREELTKLFVGKIRASSCRLDLTNWIMLFSHWTKMFCKQNIVVKDRALIGSRLNDEWITIEATTGGPVLATIL